MFAVADTHLTVADRTRRLDAVIFNILICNTGAHAKNYSILLTGRGFSLAPLYDLICAATWENVTRNLSQTIAGKDRGDCVMGRHWQRMADECGFNRTMILQRVEALAGKARRNIAPAVELVRAMPGGGHPLLGDFAAAIDSRCRTVVRNLAHVENIGDGGGGDDMEKAAAIARGGPFQTEA